MHTQAEPRDEYAEVNSEDVSPFDIADDEGGDTGEDDTRPTASLCCSYRFNRHIRRFFSHHWRNIKRVVLLLLLLGYLVYFSYCMYYKFGDEPSIRLLVGTVFLLLIVLRYLLNRFVRYPCTLSVWKHFEGSTKRGRRLRKIIRWTLYALAVGGAVIVVVLEVAMKRPENFICLAGLALLVIFCFVFSKEPETINWHAVFWGMGLQFWFAVLIRKTEFGAAAFEWLADRFAEFLKYSDKGAVVVFGSSYLDHKFVFELMPKLIFFNAVISAMYYLGLVQTFIAKFGKFLSFCIGTSPIESVNAASNLFLGVAEAPILIQPFMKDITQSEMFAVMTGGFASIAGGLLGALAAYGAPINHILTASVMSAPAALAIAKLLYPDERKPTVKAEDAYKVDAGHYGSLLGALSKGAHDGLITAGNVVVNLLVYMAVMEFLDQTLLWFGERAGMEDFTFQRLMAYVFYPVTYMMGFEAEDCFRAARLLAVKLLTTTMVSFIELGTIITNGKKLQSYIDTYNATWTYVGDDIFLEATNTTLVGGVMTERSGILATYMICGLSNLGAIGVAIGAFTSLAPTRRMEVIKHVPLALLAGNLASFSTACVAGLLYTD